MKEYSVTVQNLAPFGPHLYRLRRLKDGQLQIWHESIYNEPFGQWRILSFLPSHFSEPASVLKQLAFILEPE